MPIDQTEPDLTTGTSRRAFLARSAAGGALVATVATSGLAGGLGGLGGLLPAGAQSDGVVLADYAASAASLELAAALAYGAALQSESVTGEWVENLRQFQRNHQDAAEILEGLITEPDPDAAPIVADPAVSERFSPPAGADETAIFSQLAELEEAMAATHLQMVGRLDDAIVAKMLGQVLAVQEQQAVALGRASGASIEELTPATATTDGALEAGQAPTGAAPADVETDETDAEDADTDADESDDSTN